MPKTALAAGVRTDPDHAHVPRGPPPPAFPRTLRALRVHGGADPARCGSRARCCAPSLPTALADNQAPSYVEAVYRFLLEQIGTTYAELAAPSRGQDKVVRRALSTRLGIFEKNSSGGNDHLDGLFLDVTSAPAMTEGALQQRFGYRGDHHPAARSVDQGRGRRLASGSALASVARRGWPQPPPPRGHASADRPGPRRRARPADSAPTVTFPRTPVRPMDFLEDRAKWAHAEAARRPRGVGVPQPGFASLITDTFADRAAASVTCSSASTHVDRRSSRASRSAAGRGGRLRGDLAAPARPGKLRLPRLRRATDVQAPGERPSGADADSIARSSSSA